MFNEAYYIPNQMCLKNTSKDAVYLTFILKNQGAISQTGSPLTSQHCQQ